MFLGCSRSEAQRNCFSLIPTIPPHPDTTTKTDQHQPKPPEPNQCQPIEKANPTHANTA